MTGTGIPTWLSIVTLFMEFLVLALPVGLVLVIVGLVQYFRPQPAALGPEETARRRYASGEISRTEFDEMVHTLRGGQP
ncbi:MAG: SHOCT domain-containing protein [Thermaerobacter sp.]|nr:SHOCT domain-containing protein [Thermaerobacter sp.]